MLRRGRLCYGGDACATAGTLVLRRRRLCYGFEASLDQGSRVQLRGGIERCQFQ